jgi:tRNA threonylcarbamoyladenosine biosynthesis protein TsaB
MKLLAIETTGPLCSVALGDGEHFELLVNDTEYSHLEAVAPMCRELMERCGTPAAELDAVAVSRGPGSFTGIRIGMATAKGLAQIWDRPVICVPTLESFAYGSGLSADGSKIICPLFDARRSQVYAAALLPSSGGRARSLVPGAARDIDEFLGLLAQSAETGAEAVFYGDGCVPYAGALAAWGFPHSFAPDSEKHQLASRVIRLAALQYEAGERWDCYTAEPEYMRLAEPERKKKGQAL